MKDAKGHGSNPKGGQTPVQSENAPFKSRLGPKAGHSYLDPHDPRAGAAHQQGVNNLPPMRRAHFEEIATGLQARYDASNPAAHAQLVSHVADALSTTNPGFNRDRFVAASQPNGSMTRKGMGDMPSRSSSREKVRGQAEKFLKKFT